MAELRLIQTPEFERLVGYLSAAQLMFLKGQLFAALEAALLEIIGGNTRDENVILADTAQLNIWPLCGLKPWFNSGNTVLSHYL